MLDVNHVIQAHVPFNFDLIETGIERRAVKKSKSKVTKKKPKKSRTKVPKSDTSAILSLLQQSTMTLRSQDPSTMSAFSEYETEDEEEEGDEGEEEGSEEEALGKGSGDTLLSIRKKDTSDAVTPGILLLLSN